MKIQVYSVDCLNSFGQPITLNQVRCYFDEMPENKIPNTYTFVSAVLIN